MTLCALVRCSTTYAGSANVHKVCRNVCDPVPGFNRVAYDENQRPTLVQKEMRIAAMALMQRQ